MQKIRLRKGGSLWALEGDPKDPIFRRHIRALAQDLKRAGRDEECGAIEVQQADEPPPDVDPGG